jgi:hypothetical protein
MLYRKFGRTGVEVSALGFGCMRLPLLNADAKLGADDGAIDESKATEILRWAVDQGVNYVDTAYPYHMGNSEIFLGRALKDGYRQKVNLATKLPSWLIQSRGDMDRYLDEQLRKLQTDTIDFYLVHTVNRLFWPNLVQHRIFDFLDSALTDGRIRFAGFSFHDELDMFKEALDAYPWSFCQIQFNYLDEYYQAGKEGLQLAVDRGLGVVIMEPLKGGKLASNIPPAAREVWDRARIKRSPAEWALRYLWDYPGISVVLSGMNEMAQAVENIRIAGESRPNSLTADDRALFEEVKGIYHAIRKIDCTGCRYCMPCPSGVNIPGCFTLFNNAHMLNDVLAQRIFYSMLIGPDHKASNCVECGECEEACPQHIPIREALNEAAELLESEG